MNANESPASVHCSPFPLSFCVSRPGPAPSLLSHHLAISRRFLPQHSMPPHARDEEEERRENADAFKLLEMDFLIGLGFENFIGNLIEIQ